MTPTIVAFRGAQQILESEKDAYVWLLDRFLGLKPDLFTDPKSAPYLCKGRGGRVYFAASSAGMLDPAQLRNGWRAELNLSNDNKVQILDNAAQYAGLKRGTDWDWQAENRPTKDFIDADAMIAEIEGL